MDSSDAISADEAQKMLDRPEAMSPVEVAKLLRYLKHSNDDLVGKLRQLKSEIGRLSRKS